MKRFYTLFAILLILGISIHVGHVQNAVANEADWMPDVNLRTAVREDLGLADNEALTQAKMADLTSLHAPRAGISNLTGLEHATNLTSLVAFKNQVSSLTPLENLTSLTEIRMGSNDISDVTPLDDLTSLTKLGLQKNDISNVTPLAGLVNLTWLRLAGNSITDLLPLVTLVNVTNSDVDLPEPDTTVPGVSISVPSGVQNSAFNVTITFTETVSDFVQSEVSLSGSAASITSWSANSDDTVYTATITPTASGTVTIGVAANVATDAANNQNTAATSQTVTVDVDKPTVTIGVPSGTQTGAFDATITFTETVSDFVQSEVSLTGSVASITSWSANSDSTVYTATITPTASGTVTIGVAANVATDAANNQNTAATSKTVTVDIDKPTVTIGVPSATQTGAFDATITFSETVSGFVQSEVSLSGSAASITSWSANSANTVYTATITPTASGTVTIGVAANVATDAANNQNTAATSKTVTVNIPDPIPDPSTWMPDANLRTAVRSALNLNNNDTLTQAGMANLTRLTARNAQISSLTGLEHATNLTSLDLRDNTISNISALSGLTDLESLKLKGNNISSVSAFSRLTNLTLLNLKENNISSISTLSGLTNLEHLRVDANSITDVQPLTSLVNLEKLWIAGNSLTNAHLLSSLTGLTYIDIPIPDPPDTTAPSVTVSVPSGVQNGAFDATITFSETVSGFVQSEVSLSGSTASITSWSVDSDNTVYTATITPTASGTVTIGGAANVATDAANNQNTAATSQSVTVTILDTTQPRVSISADTRHETATSPSYVTNGPFKITITFTESVSNFEQSDIVLEHGRATIADFNTSDNKTYTAEVTPDLDEANRYVRFVIPPGAATDAAGNPNIESETNVSVDMERPNTYITVPDSDVTTETFTVEIKFAKYDTWYANEPIGFAQSDLSLTNNTAGATVTGWSSSEHIYTATITVTQSGSVTFGVAEGVATDRADNENTAAVPKTVTVTRPGSDPSETPDADTTQPSVSISADTRHETATSPSYVTNGPFKITITFTESVSNFEQSDIVLEHGRATIADFNTSDNKTYTAEVTPDLDEANRYVRFVIPPGAATDAAGNPNIESETNVSVDMERPNTYITVPDSDVTTETFTVEIKFAKYDTWYANEPIGFAQSDLSLTNNTARATVTGWSSSDHIYTATITVTQSGSVTFGVAEGVATDRANNSNTASLLKTVTVTRPGSDPPETPDTDTTQPRVSISADTRHETATSPSYVTNGPFKITITFTESVSNFEQSDIVLEYGRATIADFNTSDNKTYTAEVTPDLDEANRYVRFVIPPGAATDAAGNPNIESETNVSVDMERPNTYITVPDSDVTTETFTVEIKFAKYDTWYANEPIGFAQSDLSLTNNTAGATVTGWSSSEHIYTATITVTQSGSVTFGVAEGVATDRANNSNTASLLKTVTVTLPNAAPLASGSIPDETLLLANYPNPFNPETWIPYHLANASDVQITIYDTRGTVVRRLHLGHQREGYYTHRSHAAYWDGRNGIGERVASGIYFYQLRADEVSPLRKMVILK